MASFDENGKYIKTNWKAGDKITATKLNKIEESIEAVNDNDISRHVEADARLDALEAKDVAHDKELKNVKNLIEDAKDAAELGDYEINSRMTFLENELNEGIEEVHNVAETVDGKIAQGKADMETMVAEVEADLEGLHAKDEELSEQVAHITIDIKNFGAKGTYEQDDADYGSADGVAFQTAIDSLEGGGTILVPEGSYFIPTYVVINKSNININISPNAKIYGATIGSAIGCTFEVRGSSDNILENININGGQFFGQCDVENIIGGSYCKNVNVNNVIVKGGHKGITFQRNCNNISIDYVDVSGYNACGISFETGCVNCSIGDNVVIHDEGVARSSSVWDYPYAIQLDDDTTWTDGINVSENIRIGKCTIYNVSSGILDSCDNLNRLIIDNPYIKEGNHINDKDKRRMIEISDYREGSSKKNYIIKANIDGGTIGVYCTGVSNAQINVNINNTTGEESYGSGLHLEYCDNVKIRNSNLSNINGSYAIKFVNCQNKTALLENNNISGNYDKCLSVASSDNFKYNSLKNIIEKGESDNNDFEGVMPYHQDDVFGDSVVQRKNGNALLELVGVFNVTIDSPRYFVTIPHSFGVKPTLINVTAYNERTGQRVISHVVPYLTGVQVYFINQLLIDDEISINYYFKYN